jgi:hypothetical protein
MVTFLAALICIILGFVSGFTDKPILFDSLVWFVAAISFNTLNVVLPAMGRKTE